eukprot:Trichotokara_eunicae@DN1460_c0_g1_i1.p1
MDYPTGAETHELNDTSSTSSMPISRANSTLCTSMKLPLVPRGHAPLVKGRTVAGGPLNSANRAHSRKLKEARTNTNQVVPKKTALIQTTIRQSVENTLKTRPGFASSRSLDHPRGSRIKPTLSSELIRRDVVTGSNYRAAAPRVPSLSGDIKTHVPTQMGTVRKTTDSGEK